MINNIVNKLFTVFIVMLTVVARAHAAEKRIDRVADPVIIAGAKLESLLGENNENIRVYSFTDGNMRPVPFQIDERGPDGDLVFPFGPQKSEDVDKGLFDKNDELVVMISDFGARAAPDYWPPGYNKFAEITAVDPLNGATAHLYAFSFDNPPPRSDVDYVSISEDARTVTAWNYIISFGKEAPIGFDSLAITPAGGGNGINSVDRLKIRVKTVIRMVKITIEKSEVDFTSDLLAYIDGPVRVIRRTNNKMVIFWKIASPGSVINNIFYRDSFEFPTEVQVPFDIGLLAESFQFRVITDGNENQRGKVFINENNPDGVVFDGVMSEAEKNLDLSPYKWSVVYGTEEGRRGAWINRLEFDSELEAVPSLYYMDDITALQPPENTPGQFGALGYDVGKMETITKGVWRLTSIMYNCPEYARGDEIEYLNILDHPVEISVK